MKTSRDSGLPVEAKNCTSSRGSRTLFVSTSAAVKLCWRIKLLIQSTVARASFILVVRSFIILHRDFISNNEFFKIDCVIVVLVDLGESRADVTVGHLRAASQQPSLKFFDVKFAVRIFVELVEFGLGLVYRLGADRILCLHRVVDAFSDPHCLQTKFPATDHVSNPSHCLTRLAKQSSGLCFCGLYLSLAVRLLLLLAVEQTNLTEASMNSYVAAQSDSPGLGFVATPRLR